MMDRFSVEIGSFQSKTARYGSNCCCLVVVLDRHLDLARICIIMVCNLPLGAVPARLRESTLTSSGDRVTTRI